MPCTADTGTIECYTLHYLFLLLLFCVDCCMRISIYIKAVMSFVWDVQMTFFLFQPVCIRSPHCNSINGKLIHLTRFFIEFRPKYMVLLEGLTSRLAAKTHQREQLSQIRSEMVVLKTTIINIINSIVVVVVICCVCYIFVILFIICSYAFVVYYYYCCYFY